MDLEIINHSVGLRIVLYLSIYLSIFLSIYLSIDLTIHLSMYQSIHLYIWNITQVDSICCQIIYTYTVNTVAWRAQATKPPTQGKQEGVIPTHPSQGTEKGPVISPPFSEYTEGGNPPSSGYTHIQHPSHKQTRGGNTSFPLPLRVHRIR